MSYSSDAKAELCRFTPESICCNLAELSGIVSAAGSLLLRGGGQRRLAIETENEQVASRTASLLTQVFDVQPTLVTRTQARLGGRQLYRVLVEGDEALFVLRGCGIELPQRRAVPRDVVARKCCKMAFLRGVFLACGSVADPQRAYHLEFVLTDEAFADSLVRHIARFNIQAHTGKRRRATLVYLKGQADIADMLSIVGAQNARFAMEDAYIHKGFRNNANRAVNCDSANLSRAIAASERQTAAIRRLQGTAEFAQLPEALREMAQLRLENPDCSLEELGQMLTPPLGKSGVNHRLQRLMRLADTIA